MCLWNWISQLQNQALNFIAESQTVNISPGRFGWKSQKTALAALSKKGFEVGVHRTAGSTDGEYSRKVRGSQPQAPLCWSLSTPSFRSSPAEDSDQLPPHTQCGPPNGDLPLGIHTTSPFKQWPPSPGNRGVRGPSLVYAGPEGRVVLLIVGIFIPAVTGWSI